MHRLVIGGLAAFAIVGAASPASAQNPLAVGAALTAIQERFFSGLDGSVNNAFDRADMSVVNARAQFDGLLASARNDLFSVLDKSETQLDGQQRKLFLAYMASLDELADRADGFARTGQMTALTVGNVAALSTVIGSRRPVIFWVTADPPLYKKSSSTRTFTAQGLNLHDQRNSLSVNGSSALLNSATPQELKFSISGAGARPATMYMLNYELLESRPLWVDRRVPVTFRLNAPTDLLGRVSLVYTVPTYPTHDRRYPADPSKYYQVTCKGKRKSDNECTARPSVFVGVTPGHSIVHDSIRIRADSEVGCVKGGHTLNERNVSDNGFSLVGYAESDDGYGKKYCRANFHVTFKEKVTNPVPVAMETAASDFRFSTNGTAFRLPLEATPVRLELHDARGTKTPFSLSSPRVKAKVRFFTGSGVFEIVPR